MTDKQSEALRLADLLVKATLDKDLFTTALGFDAANELSVLDYKAKEQTAELRRLHAENEALRAGEAFHKVAVQQRNTAWMENEALHKANEAFGKRQEWWNARMFELEKQRDELLEQLSKIVEMIDPGGHDVVRRVRRRPAVAR